MKLLIGKCMVIGIIFMFFWINIIPSTAQTINENQNYFLEHSVTEKYNSPNVIYQKIFPNNPHFKINSVYKPLKLNNFQNGYLFYHQAQQKEMFRLQVDDNDNSSVTNNYTFLYTAEGNYTPHDPIWIDGDTGFMEENGVVSGHGLIDDPYIIEGWKIISPYNFGIVVLNTRSYFLVRNCYFETGDSCIATSNITNGTFNSSILYCNMAIGVYIDSSSNVSINNLHINCYSYYGLLLEESSDIYFNNLTVNALVGLESYDSEKLSLINCLFSCSYPGYGEDTRGISLYGSSCVILTNLIIHDYYFGILLLSTPDSMINDCEVFSNSWGIVILGSPHQTLRGNNLHDNTNNLDIEGSILDGHSIEEYYHNIDQSNIINGKPVYYLYNASNLIFDETMDIGYLGFIHCSNIRISNMTMTNGGQGVLFVSTCNSSVISCDFQISSINLFYNSKQNIIRNCQSEGGIYIYWSAFNILQNNTLTNQIQGLNVYGELLQDFYQDIDVSNTINGKPIYYLVEKKNQIFKESNIGFLGLINCKNIVLSNVTMSGFYEGPLLAYSNVILRKCTFTLNNYGLFLIHSRALIQQCVINENAINGIWAEASHVSIYNCELKNNFYGIEFINSSAAAVVHCNITGNLVGIVIDYTSHNTIIRNCIISHALNGIQIRNSYNNLICCSNISLNYRGIWMEASCRENEIYNNIFSNQQNGITIVSSTDNSLHHNTIYQMESSGIELRYSADNNDIHHNNITKNYDGLYFWYCGENNTVINNNIYGNSYGARAWHCTANVTHNWWGSIDGPSGIGHGSGNPVYPVLNATMTFEPWLTQVMNTESSFFQLLQTIIRFRLYSIFTWMI
jgi:parallel beta-helix repeat protein